MFLLFSKKMIQNTGNRVCYTLDFPTIDDFGANEVGLPLMILSDHFETAPVFFCLHGVPGAKAPVGLSLDSVCTAYQGDSPYGTSPAVYRTVCPRGTLFVAPAYQFNPSVFLFPEHYSAVFFPSDPVFLFRSPLSYNHGQGMTGKIEGGTERCI